jgi:hypothetical protein
VSLRITVASQAMVANLGPGGGPDPTYVSWIGKEDDCDRIAVDDMSFRVLGLLGALDRIKVARQLMERTDWEILAAETMSPNVRQVIEEGERNYLTVDRWAHVSIDRLPDGLLILHRRGKSLYV